jgi:hypothetical protein
MYILRMKDRQQLAAMLTKGRESAGMVRRASILLQLDNGQRVAQVAPNVDGAAKTVRPVGRRHGEEGLESEQYEKAGPANSERWTQAKASESSPWCVVRSAGQGAVECG